MERSKSIKGIAASLLYSKSLQIKFLNFIEREGEIW